MKEFDINILLQSLSIVSSLVITLGAALYLFKELLSRQRKRRQEVAEIELMRKNYEDKIYRLTDKLVSSGERWEDINHLLLSPNNFYFDNLDRTDKIYLTNYLKNAGLKETDTFVQKDSVFILTPFNPKFEETYLVIRKTCERLGLRCFRGDEQFIKGEILPNILKQIAQSRLIIANIDGRNPNVFYELGIAHAMDKPVLMLASSVDELTFDLQSKQVLLYKSRTELSDKLREWLTKLLIHG